MEAWILLIAGILFVAGGIGVLTNSVHEKPLENNSSNKAIDDDDPLGLFNKK